MKISKTGWWKWTSNWWMYILFACATVVIFTTHIGTLTHNKLLKPEIAVQHATYGWHRIIDNPLNLPMVVMRSVVYRLSPEHGVIATRLPSVLFVLAAIASLTWLVYLWHGKRTAAITWVLFATSAIALHIGRFASADVLYLWAIPTLLLAQALFSHNLRRPWAIYVMLLMWSLLIYIPGMIWLVALSIWWQRQAIIASFRHTKSILRHILWAICGLAWVPLLVAGFMHSTSVATWLGLNLHGMNPAKFLHNLVATVLHISIRGTGAPYKWLGNSVTLDAFTLALAFLGLYFYLRNIKATRAKLLGSIFAIGIVLVALGGVIPAAALIPLMYLLVAAGCAWLLHEWMHIFPKNPIARGVGIGLIIFAVIVSCTYNLRAYFVAWPPSVNSAIISENKEG